MLLKIIHSDNLELKPEKSHKNITEEKNEKKQASNSAIEELAEVINNEKSDKKLTKVKSLEHQLNEVG